MLDRLLKIEEQLARAEALLLVVLVLLMLALATYNVLYRNILVPIQVDLLTKDSPTSVEKAPPERPSTTTDDTDRQAESADESGGFGGGFEGEADEADGFGGGFGDEADEADGFGGGFGDESPDEAADSEESAPAEPEVSDDAAGGFGGGFGDAPPAEEPAEPESGAAEVDGAGGFGGGFEGDGDESGFGGDFAGDGSDPAAESSEGASPAPVEKPEDPWVARAIDSLKLEWIDVLLRQFVLIVGFLGAMLATRRRKHITIDALSKVTPEGVMRWMNVLTNVVSIAICSLLTAAGLDLVQISIEYPTELMSWAEEWHFQLAFPIGFGLLVVHFTIRLIESIYYAMGWAQPRELVKEEGGPI